MAPPTAHTQCTQAHQNIGVIGRPRAMIPCRRLRRADRPDHQEEELDLSEHEHYTSVFFFRL